MDTRVHLEHVPRKPEASDELGELLSKHTVSTRLYIHVYGGTDRWTDRQRGRCDVHVVWVWLESSLLNLNSPLMGTTSYSLSWRSWST